MKLLPALLLLPFALFAADPAAAETVNCTNITSIPTTISTQGVYCLKQDVATSIASGVAITINTNNVTLDCNDFKIGGIGAGLSTTAIGIQATNRTNMTVRNCNIRGFYGGIFISGNGGGHTIENNRIEQSTYLGIQIGGAGSVIRRNRVVGTGGSPGTLDAYGIYASGAVDILDNAVYDVSADGATDGSVLGIYADSPDGRVIAGNRVSGLLPVGSGSRYGIYVVNSGQTTIRDNSVAFGLGTPTANDIGIRCTPSGNSLARDNAISGFVAPSEVIHGCWELDNLSH